MGDHRPHTAREEKIRRAAVTVQQSRAQPDAERPETTAARAPVGEPLAGVTYRLGDHKSSQAHASTLRRATDSRPNRAPGSLIELQRRYGNRYVRRVLDVARQGEGETELEPQVERSIQARRGGGQALDGTARGAMEPAFGADFGGVRVHADGAADALNRSLNARAFTTGKDIFFRQGAYAPGSSTGRELLAHELTHVVQQTGDRIAPKLRLGAPGDRLEQEADRVAREVMAREQSPVAARPQDGALSRQVEEGEEEGVAARRDEGVVERQPEEQEEEIPA